MITQRSTSGSFLSSDIGSSFGHAFSRVDPKGFHERPSSQSNPWQKSRTPKSAAESPPAGFAQVVTISEAASCPGGTGCLTTCTKGDVSGGGGVTLADIAPFADALTSPPACTTAPFCAADMNSDEALDGKDIPLFIDALIP